MKVEDLITIDEAESRTSGFIMMSKPSKTELRRFIQQLDCIVGHDERVEAIKEKLRHLLNTRHSRL